MPIFDVSTRLRIFSQMTLCASRTHNAGPVIKQTRSVVPVQETDNNQVEMQNHWGLAAGYQPRPQVVDRGMTTRYGGQLRYKRVSSPDI